MKMVPRILTPEQKENHKNICSDILERIQEQQDFLKNVITCDKTCIFHYSLETKWQLKHWKFHFAKVEENSNEQVEAESDVY